ncbi:MAG: stage II sporulation protein D [Clostridia bacterium]|nr:stage II sporulation protein D [Clostridia bacterium]
MRRGIALAAAFLALMLVLVLGIPLLLVRQRAPSGERPPTAPEPLVTVHDGGTKRRYTLPLEEYVKGVVAAEMPASFHMEALKAQAVVARTYALRRLRANGGQGCTLDPAADVCAGPEQGQAWLPAAEARRRWGLWNFLRSWRRISAAVEATRGLVVLYGGELIDAVYHSASGGVTEDAAYVWGREVPYLRSVASPFEPPNAYSLRRTLVTWDDLAAALDLPVETLYRREASGLPVVQVLERSPSGRALRVRVVDRTLAGAELRRRLNLASTLLTSRDLPAGVEFTTRGYGHGVGLSQYGSEGMARRGADFRAIIRHYYTGADVGVYGKPRVVGAAGVGGPSVAVRAVRTVPGGT